MAKLVLNDVTNLSNQNTAKQTMNDNWAEIEAAFDNTLSRDGATPNQMEADIDLNDNDLLNVKSIDSSRYLLNGVPLEQTVAYANKRYELFSGNDVQVTFGLSKHPGSLGNLEVTLEGLMQRPGIDYNFDGTALTFITPPPDGTNNLLVRYDDALPTGVADADQVEFMQSGAGASSRTLMDKGREIVTITDFGGKDDDVFDNASAFTFAKTRVGVGGTIVFPKTDKNDVGVYYFNTDPDLSGVVLDVDPRVTLRGPFALFPDIKVERDVDVRITSQNYNVTLSEQHKKPFAQKSLYLTEGDLDLSEVLEINTSSVEVSHEKINFQVSDTWVDASGDASPFGDLVTWNSITADGVLRATFTRVRPNEELTCAFPATGSYRRAVVIRTTSAYYYVYADGSSSAPHFGGKVVGSPATDVAFTYNDNTKEQYQPENSTWSVRIYDRNHFGVFLNGQEVTNRQAAFGEIIDVGFGVQGIAGSATLHVSGWTRWRDKPLSGKRDITVLCVGDSMTADLHGGWPYAMREALENSFGIRVNSVTNQAVSGANSTTQLALLSSTGTGGASHVFICIGTNDIQFGASSASLISNIDAMLSICTASFATPIVWVPPLWYSQADAGGEGQNTQGMGLGADHRARIMRLCALRGVKCVDMTQETGPALAAYLGSATVDPFYRDNIHPTMYAYRIIGYRMARALAGSYVTTTRRSQPITVLGSSGLANGWLTSIQSAQYSMDSDGMVQLSGLFNGGTVTDGTIVYTLPKHLRPQAQGRYLCANNTTAAALLQVNTDGTIQIYNAAAVTYVAIDGISYQTAG